jgi:hypothetical protein
MLKNVLCIAMLAAVAVLPAQVRAQGSAPNLSGTYNCTPEPIKCQNSSYMVMQNGNVLEVKAQDGPVFQAKLTSNVTITAGPPFNSNGVVLPDSSIQWSNGTHWRK